MEIHIGNRNATAVAKQWQAYLRSAHWLWMSLMTWAVTRLGIAAVTYFAVPMIIDPSPRTYTRPENTLLDAFAARWDTGFYIQIAQRGYHYQSGALTSIAFFPLLPLLIRVGTHVFGDPLLTGVIVTNLALLAATMLFYCLVEDEWGSGVADRAVWYLLIFPTSFFGSAIYTESLFLLGSIGALYTARKGYWALAALLGIFTSASRLVGVIVAPMLFVEWWMQRQRHTGTAKPTLTALAAPLVAPLGAGAYMLYLQRSFGDALAFAHASAAWGRKPGSPIHMIMDVFQRPKIGWKAAFLGSHVPLDAFVDIGSVFLFLGFGCILLRQRRWSEAVFVLLGALLSISSGLWASQRRYMWVLFPAFILLARWGERRGVDRLITAISLLLLGLFTTMFVNWYWVA